MAEKPRTLSPVPLLAGLVLLAALGVGGLLLFRGGGADRAEVYLDGELYAAVDLRAVREPYTLPIGDGNVLEVDRGRVRMLSADCPDQICVHQSWSSEPAKPIVCLPNRVTVLLTGGGGETDAVLG
jgi:hypothetical protein